MDHEYGPVMPKPLCGVSYVLLATRHFVYATEPHTHTHPNHPQDLPPGKDGERCLLLWGVEDAVKRRYQQYVQLLEKCRCVGQRTEEGERVGNPCEGRGIGRLHRGQCTQHFKTHTVSAEDTHSISVQWSPRSAMKTVLAQEPKVAICSSSSSNSSNRLCLDPV
jgi:hypothetical protein